jgi:hypothetical protein
MTPVTTVVAAFTSIPWKNNISSPFSCARFARQVGTLLAAACVTKFFGVTRITPQKNTVVRVGGRPLGHARVVVHIRQRQAGDGGGTI